MKTKKTIGLLLAIICFVSSCDYIDRPYTVPGPNGCTSPEPDFIPRQNPVRKILIEDFTGHRCGFCPNAHNELTDLQTQFGDQVIGIVEHSANNSLTDVALPNPENKYIYNFRSAAAKAIDDQFQVAVNAIPNGMVNRIAVGGDVKIAYQDWENRVTTLLAIPQQMDIQLKNYWDPAAKSVCSYAYTQALEDLNSNYKLVMLLTESNIVNWQKFYGNTPEEIPDYIHNHVLRASITNVWGVSLANGLSMKTGESLINGYSISTENTDWNIDELHVVAFVYDATNFEIIQAEEQKVIP